MRTLTSHQINDCNKAITVEAREVMGAGGAPTEYRVTIPKWEHPSGRMGRAEVQINMPFQEGPPAEVGSNGITHEVLLAILEDRISCFQTGRFACEENATALSLIREVQAILLNRTRKRDERGVEGTHAV